MKPALGDGEGGLADGAAPVSLDDAGRTQSTTKGGSVGSPMELLKVVVRALRSVVGETRMLFEHRNSANFHMMCPDIIVDTCMHRCAHPREAAGRADLGVPQDRPGRHRGREGVDLQQVASAGSMRYKEILDAKDRTRRYKEVEADIREGRRYRRGHNVRGVERTPAAQTRAE